MQGGNAQNKKRFIIVSLILILSLALPCFATVTESSGDGFALYNGVKLPNIDSVWSDKVTYPYAYITKHVDYNTCYLFLSSFPFYSNGDNVYASAAGSYQRYTKNHSELSWGNLNTKFSSSAGFKVVDLSNNEMFFLYSSSDLFSDADQTMLYLAASTPISLDDYSVIEWDGVTTGLPVEQDAFYMVSPFFDQPSSGIGVAIVEGERQYFGDVWADPSANGWIAGNDSNDDFFVLGVPSGGSVSSGVYFPRFDSTSYTQLFAYRESETEGPTGAVTGLTITYPPVGESDFIAYAGSDVQCTATVTGTGDFNPAVTWSVQYSAEYNPDVYPTISETGLLHLPATMLEQRIVVVATSVEDPTIGAIVPIYIMPPAVTSVTISPSSVTAAPGQNIQFSATVSGSNVEDSAVTWAVGGASSSSTRITRDGLLLIGSDEVSPVIVVRATSDQDGSVYGTALVTINIPAAVTGVSITPDDIVLNRGDVQQFTATVSGTGSYDNSVTWQITSVYSAGTSISNTGLLTIGEEQKYDYIIIKATSTADPSLSASAYVFVEDAVSDPMNIDLSVLERLLEEIKNYLKTLQHIFDRPHYFREFNMYTGKLNEQDEQITGLTFNFYRFMQNMEEYVGSIAYTFANGAEVQIREDTTEGFDWFSLFFGKDSGSKVEKSDFAGISTIVTNTRDLFDTGFGFSDFFELIGSVPFFTNEVGSQLDTTVSYFDVRDPDPFNMSVLGNRDEQLEEWRNKHTD